MLLLRRRIALARGTGCGSFDRLQLAPEHHQEGLGLEAENTLYELQQQRAHHVDVLLGRAANCFSSPT